MKRPLSLLAAVALLLAAPALAQSSRRGGDASLQGGTAASDRERCARVEQDMAVRTLELPLSNRTVGG